MIACPGCGAGLRFDIPSQKMKCDYCGEFHDPDLFRITNSNGNRVPYYDAYAFDCPSCGAELITTDKTDATGFCPYCGNTAILFDRLRKVKMPAYIIPFQLTKEDCKKAYRRAARKAVFTPARYKRPELIDSFRGIYMPYWSYSVRQKGTAKVKATGRTTYSGDYAYTDNYDISGEVDVQYDAYAHDASVAFDDEISECLFPFRTENRRNFSPAYLSGFYADIADEPLNKYKGDALHECELRTAEQLLRRENVKTMANANAVKLKSAAEVTVPGEVTAIDQVLYPVWFMSYREKDRITYATVNGQTGKVVADFPISPVRFLLAAFLLAGLLFLGLNTLFTLKPEWALGVTSLLMLLGIWLSGRSFSSDTDRKIDLKRIIPYLPYLFLAVFMIFGLRIMLSGKSDRGVGFFFFMIGVFLSFVTYTVDRKNATRTQEARYQAFSIPSWEKMLAAILLCAAVLILAIRPVYNIVYYIASLAQALVLFLAIYQSFRYHRALAMRRPPQFRKKGGQDNA